MTSQIKLDKRNYFVTLDVKEMKWSLPCLLKIIMRSRTRVRGSKIEINKNLAHLKYKRAYESKLKKSINVEVV